ncbi:MAG: UvrD-helicase domain-containing protein [Planctomycetia bacterium]|nr:UvrD-helicase domain-containing protein [Planctomycetia bacterium]
MVERIGNGELDSLLTGLNAAQAEAVRFKDGPLLVLAGPGSGKTRVVTHRIAALLRQGVPGWRILALTFTNKAASEMKNRLELLVPGNRVWLGTFHAFCARLLRSYGTMIGLNQNFTIYDSSESRLLLDRLIDKHALPTGVDSGKIGAAISWAKNSMVFPEDYKPAPGNVLGDVVEKTYPQYQEALQMANAVDFDDLLLSTARLLQTNPQLRADLDARYEYILVDEYQDTNLVQYAIVRALSIDRNNLGVTGDPDQSIYGWRGASIRNILEFEKNFKAVKVIRLEQNYRSTPEILEAASYLIKHNTQRKDKELYTENASGPRVRLLTCSDQQEEADSIAKEIRDEITSGRRRAGEYAIFYRTNALSRNLEHAFHRAGVPFQLIRGLEFFGRREVRDVLAWLQILHNPNDVVAFRRIVNLPPRGIGQVTIHRLEAYAAVHRIPLLAAAGQAEQVPQLTTKSRLALKRFCELIGKLYATAADNDLEVLLSVLLNETGYLTLFNSGSEEDKERQENVQELLSEVREFDKMARDEEETSDSDPDDPLVESRTLSRLGRFLERTALVSDVDALKSDADSVCLMSLHAAKGLEFPVVYIVALEDNILPHERSMSNPNQMEEERRLLFVGMTRAKEELRLSHARRREYRGFFGTAISSRFLFELPRESLFCTDSQEDSAVNQDSQGTPEEGLFLSDLLAGRDRETSRDSNGDLRFDSDLADNDELSMDEGPEITRLTKPARKPRASAKRRRKSSGPAPASTPGDGGVQIEYDEEAIREQEASGVPVESAKSISRKKKNAMPFVLPGALITTAAELDGAGHRVNRAAPDAEQIRPGTVIRHRDYGLGNVLDVQGPRSDRILTVQFFSGVGTIDLPANDPDLHILRTRERASDS